jgi:hypothetical protein
MEGSKMHIKTSLIILSLLIFVGCENSMTKSDQMFDDQLMQDIIDAEKIDINMTDLPSLSRTVIDLDYNDYIEIDAKIASGLGYQVSMDGKGCKTGYHNEVYFNLEGRKLKSKRDRGDKDGFKCFELVLPATFVMPDGSTITVEDENGYMAVRDWYANNSDSKEKPTLQYPVNIIYRDGYTQTINNNEEMGHTKADCRKWDDDKKDWGCFRLVYPITFIMQDGSAISMIDKEDWMGLKSWYEENPDKEERPLLEYPVEINYGDGSTKTINNNDEMSSAKEDCRD